MKLTTKLSLQHLDEQTEPALLKKHLQQRGIKFSGNCNTIDRRRVKTGAVQVKAELYTNVLEYAGEMCRHAERAAAEGVQLLVFPENNSFQLLGLVPEMAALSTEPGGDGFPVRAAHLLRLAGPLINRAALQIFSFLAGAYGIYIMAGSFPCLRDGDVTNSAFLFGPDGRQMGRQDKVHLMPIEHLWGLAPGRAFEVYPTPLGRLAMPVCMDATYFETFRLLENKGAEIVMVPIANAQPYNFWLALRGIWARVQESMVYGIKSALVGELLGFTLTGKAGIFAPLELTPEGDGVLGEASFFDRETLVSAVLDLEALGELKKNHPYLGDKNPAFAEKYFPSVYHRAKINGDV